MAGRLRFFWSLFALALAVACSRPAPAPQLDGPSTRAGSAYPVPAASSFLFDPSVAGATVGQVTRAGTGANAGGTLIIQAQAGQQQTGTNANNNGGSIEIASGSAGTGGSGAAGANGNVTLYTGSTEVVLSPTQLETFGASVAFKNAAITEWLNTPANTQTGTFLHTFGFLHTTSISPATIVTVGALASSHVETIEAVVNSIDTTTLGSSAAAKVACSFYNSGGTLTQLTTTTTLYNHNYTSAPSCAISGTSVNIQVTPKTTDATDSQADVYVSVN